MGEVEDDKSIIKARNRGTVARTPNIDTDLSKRNQQPLLEDGNLLQRSPQQSTLQECPPGRCRDEAGGGKEFGREGEDKERARVHSTDNHVEDEGASGGQSFLCNVVPLSLALRHLGIAAVDLLKVDVEGDELAVLQGISADDWPKIRQVEF